MAKKTYLDTSHLFYNYQFCFTYQKMHAIEIAASLTTYHTMQDVDNISDQGVGVITANVNMLE